MNSAPDPTRDALYAAILAHPDEDTPRLAYADHVEEMGDSARAEFIRAQCRLATTNEWDDGHTALDVRCRRLLAEHPEWHRGLGFDSRVVWSGESTFRRGFAEHGEFSAGWFRTHFEDTFRAVPLRSAAIRATGANQFSVGELTGCAALGRLRRLTLTLDNGSLGALADVPHLAGLERLCVWVSEPLPARLKELAESPHLRNLRAFDLRFNSSAGHFPKAGERWDWFPQLRELALAPYLTQDHYCARLFATGAWRRLERLALRADHEDGGRAIFAALTGSRLPNLIDLAVDRAEVSPEGLGPLLDLDRPPLRSLRLPNLRPSYSARPREVADGLLHAPWLRDLRRLGLTSANIVEAWLTSVADAPCAKTLRVLDLAGAVFEPRAYVTAFGPRRRWPNLQRLNLWYTRCADEVLAALVDHPGLQSLVSLTAGQGQPAPKLLARLADSPAAARFRELDLSVKLDDATASALARSPHLETLDRLKVMKGSAGRTACNRLARRFGARLTLESSR